MTPFADTYFTEEAADLRRRLLAFRERLEAVTQLADSLDAIEETEEVRP